MAWLLAVALILLGIGVIGGHAWIFVAGFIVWLIAIAFDLRQWWRGIP